MSFKKQNLDKLNEALFFNGEVLKILIFFLFIFSSSSVLSIELNSIDVDLTIKKSSCEKEINNQLEAWNIGEEKWRALLSDDGLIYVRPTKMMSVWVQYQNDKVKTILSKLTPENVTLITFDQKCKKTLQVMKEKESKAVLENEVDDKKLFSLINKHTTGLIYTWSPHMTLSVEGIKKIRVVSKKMNLPLIILMDANSEVELAKSRLRNAKIALDELLPSTSMELYLRRTNIHYPNLIVFKNGKIVDGMLPGISNFAQYEKFIQDKLSK